MNCMKVDGVRLATVSCVEQGELDRVVDAYADDRSGDGVIEGPSVVEDGGVRDVRDQNDVL